MEKYLLFRYINNASIILIVKIFKEETSEKSRGNWFLLIMVIGMANSKEFTFETLACWRHFESLWDQTRKCQKKDKHINRN